MVTLLAEQAPHDLLVLSVDASSLPLLVNVVEGALLVGAVRRPPILGLIHVHLRLGLLKVDPTALRLLPRERFRELVLQLHL